MATTIKSIGVDYSEISNVKIKNITIEYTPINQPIIVINNK